MRLGRPEDGPGESAVHNEVCGGELGLSDGIGDRINAHNRHGDHMRDTCLAGSLQQTARAFDIDLPGMAVPTGGGMDYHINALDCLSQARTSLQISLHPLRARPILSWTGSSTHPTHGIACRAQLLHHQAAQSSRAAGHQNMLHNLSSRVSLYFTCLSRERLASKTKENRAMCNPPAFFLSLSWGSTRVNSRN